VNRVLRLILILTQGYNILFSFYYFFYIGVGNLIPERTLIDTILLNLAIELPILAIVLIAVLVIQYLKTNEMERIVLIILVQSVLTFFTGLCFVQFTPIVF
jgi:hypothetical protein